MPGVIRTIEIIVSAAVIALSAATAELPQEPGKVLPEPSYMAKSTRFYKGKKKAVMRLYWSKSYAKLDDGTVSDVDGYEIQYSSRKDFSRSKKIVRSADVHSAMLEFPKLNTKKKYRKNINKYRVRIRSYVSANGRKYYSAWTNAAKAKKVKVYGPVIPTSVKVAENSVTLKWNDISGCDGYEIYARESGGTEWKKVFATMNIKNRKFTDNDLEYDRDYEYTVLSYKRMVARDPRRLNSSCYELLDTSEYVNLVSISEFKVEAPDFTAKFKAGVLKTEWEKSEKADKYHIEYATSEDFADAKETVVDASKLTGEPPYTYDIEGLNAETTYYVRLRASGEYKGVRYYSDYLSVQKVKYDTQTYTIKFIGNSATTGKMGSYSVIVGEEFTLPYNTYTRDGYEFAGWSLVQNNEVDMTSFQIGNPDFDDGQTVKDLAAADGMVTLYACWRGAGPEAAADWAIRVAKDDTFYYGNKVVNHCWFCKGGNKTYTCNSFAAAAYTHGMPYFDKYRAGNTGPTWWAKEGFTKVGKNIGAGKIKKGDLICCWNGKRWSHIMIAVDDNKVAHAAHKGTGPDTICIATMQTRLEKYKYYYVVRYDPAAAE